MKHLLLCNQVQRPCRNKEKMKKNVQNWTIPRTETKLNSKDEPNLTTSNDVKLSN